MKIWQWIFAEDITVYAAAWNRYEKKDVWNPFAIACCCDAFILVFFPPSWVYLSVSALSVLLWHCVHLQSIHKQIWNTSNVIFPHRLVKLKSVSKKNTKAHAMPFHYGFTSILPVQKYNRKPLVPMAFQNVHIFAFVVIHFIALSPSHSHYFFYPQPFCSISKSGEPHLYADIFHFIILIARIFMVFILEKKKPKPKRNWIRMICAKRMNNIHWKWCRTVCSMLEHK